MAARTRTTARRAPRAVKKPRTAKARKAPKRASAKKRRKAAGDLPAFIPPQLCKLVDRPPAGADWVHEIKFDGYRVQMRAAAGRVTLKTRKGLDWTAKFPEIATAASEAA